MNNERALNASLILTSPEITVKNTQAWLLGENRSPALSPELEAKLIKSARYALSRAP